MSGAASFKLVTERLGPLPLVNHFLARMGLEDILERHVPTEDRRVRLPYAASLGVLLRSIIVEREPIYRQQETVATFAPKMFGLDARTLSRLSDDRIGRGLDRLFDADRAALLTDVVIAVGKRFGVGFAQLHNDSTTIRLSGQYRGATGRRVRGKRAALITYGYSKDHRPDLKQLLFSLTTSADGGVPVQFRCADGKGYKKGVHVPYYVSAFGHDLLEVLHDGREHVPVDVRKLQPLSMPCPGLCRVGRTPRAMAEVGYGWALY